MKTITIKSTKKRNILTIAFLILVLNLLTSTPKTLADLLPGGETDITDTSLDPNSLVGPFPLYIIIGILVIIIAITSFVVLAKLRKK